MADAENRADNLPPLLAEIFSEAVTRRVLPNGLTVLFKPDAGHGLVSTQVWLRSGSVHEGALLGSGVSHYLEHLLFRGTERRSGPEINRAVQGFGGNFNAYTTFDRTVYFIDGPREAIGETLDILGDMAYRSTLSDESCAAEKEIILREIDMANDDPHRAVSQALFRNAFRVHPYRFPILGEHDLFAALTPDDVRGYYARRYRPANTVLVIVGDLDPSEVFGLVEASPFGQAPSRSLEPVEVPDEPPQIARREERIEADVQLTRGSLGFRIPGLSHSDGPGLDLLAAVLGHGHSARLWRRLREERQLVHEIDAAAWNPGKEGLLWISYSADPNRTAEIENAIVEELARAARDGFSDNEVQRAQRLAVVAEINVRKTVAGQASRLGLAEVVIGDLGYAQVYFQRLRRLDASRLQALVQAYLVPERLTAISVGPRGSDQGFAAPALSARRAPGDFTLETLSNGARILLQPDPRLPKVHVRVAFRGGSALEPPEVRGVTGVMATLLTRDTRRQAAAEVADEIEGMGGLFAEHVGNNSFSLALEVLPADLDAGLRILREGLLAPSFHPQTLGREVESQLAQIREDEDEILELGRKELRRKFFGDHPLAVDAFGTADSLARVDRSQVLALYRRLVVAPNCVVSVTGDFQPGRLLPRLKGLLYGMPGWAFHDARPSFPERAAEPGEHLVPAPREQAVVLVGFPSTAIGAPAFYTGELLEELCSEMSGRLFTRVREELNLAYYVGAQRIQGLDTGMFVFYAGTAPRHVETVLKEIRDEVTRLREHGPLPEEVERCRARLRVQRRTSWQSLGVRARQVGLNVLYGLDPNLWKTYDERLAAITPEACQTFAQTWFDPTRSATVIAGGS